MIPPYPPSDSETRAKRQPVDAEGHRARMAERLFKTVDYDISERETLEMLLYYSIARADTRDRAVYLIQRHKTLDRVLHTDERILTATDGIGSASASMLRLMGEAADRIGAPHEPPSDERCSDQSEELIALFRKHIGEIGDRTFTWIAAFDAGLRVRRVEPLFPGTLGTSPTHLRLLLDYVVAGNVSRIALAKVCHGSFTEPDAADLTAASKIGDGLYLLGYQLADYIIINDAGSFSISRHMLL